MSRPVRVVVVLAVVLAVLGGGSALSHVVSARIAVRSSKPSTSDAGLARVMLADQLPALRRDFRGSWRQLGVSQAELMRCSATRASLGGHIAAAISRSFVWDRRLGLEVADFVDANSPAASRALSAVHGRADELCVARAFAAWARKQHYVLGGLPDVIYGRSGATPLVLEFFAPGTYKGRAFTFSVDEIAARTGRVIVAALVTGYKGLPDPYPDELKIIATLTHVAGALQHPHQEHVLTGVASSQ